MGKEPLEILKEQGLKKFEIHVKDEPSESATIWMNRVHTNSARNLIHVKGHANRLLCETECVLPENSGPIKCDKIGTERQGVSYAAEITSRDKLPPNYWEALAGRIPCNPDVVKAGW